MADEFLSDLPPEAEQIQRKVQRERIKHVLYGSKRAIAHTIHQLHNRGYAETSDWSRPQPTETPGEFMSILLRYLLLN